MHLQRITLFDHILRFGFFLALLVTIVFALYPELKLPEPKLTRGMTDLLYHGLGFMGLSLIGGLAWRSASILPFGLSLGAVALELAQFFSPGRGVHFHDIVASLTGVAFGLSLLFLMRQVRRVWINFCQS